jgi:hypothetical protein
MPLQNPGNSVTRPDKLKDLPEPIWGEPKLWALLTKTQDPATGVISETKAIDLEQVGTLVSHTVTILNSDGSYSLSTSLAYVPDVYVHEEKAADGRIVARKLVRYDPPLEDPSDDPFGDPTLPR